MNAAKRYSLFCKQFRDERRATGLSLREVEKRTKVHYSIIQRFESGKKVDVLHAITLSDWTVSQPKL